jgi:hypothetical protein
MTSWGEFAAQAPELAAFGAARLAIPPAYIATIRADGTPRVHPMTPIIGNGQLFVFMEPTSPKGHDLVARRSYSLHSSVADTFGTGGEFFIRGEGTLAEDPESRVAATAAAGYDPADRYILFTLRITEARCNGYGDVPLPDPTRWQAQAPS